MKTLITKTDYLSYLVCKKNFWLSKNKPELFENSTLSDYELKIIEEGNFVDTEIIKIFPEAQLITTFGEKSIKETKALLNKKETILQSSFQYENFYIKADVIKYKPEKKEWDLYEVKSTTKVDKSKQGSHIDDITFQKLIIEKTGIKIGNCYIVHLNGDYLKNGKLDYSELFIKENVDDLVLSNTLDTESKILEIKNYITSPEQKGCDCIYKSKTNHCESFNYSNPEVPSYSVYNLNRFTSNTKLFKQYIKEKIISLDDIPSEEGLNGNKLFQYKSYKKKSPVIDKKAIKDRIDNLDFPLQFLDFETYSSAIAKFDGFKVHEPVPIQYSLFRLDKNKKIEHFEFIQENYSDKITSGIMESLKNNMLNEGTIICWNKSFEIGRLKKLGELHPENKDYIDSVIEKVFDLMEVFSKNLYVDYKFMGSSSLKKVLPVLIENEGYENLDVQDGAQAITEWEKIIFQNITNDEKKSTIDSLLEYCKYDTYSMIKIYNFLVNLS
jgi:hypothetical protein